MSYSKEPYSSDLAEDIDGELPWVEDNSIPSMGTTLKLQEKVTPNCRKFILLLIAPPIGDDRDVLSCKLSVEGETA
jgi:hypothetical protein